MSCLLVRQGSGGRGQEFITIGGEERIGSDDERADPALDKGRKRRLEVAVAPCFHIDNLPPHGTRCREYFTCLPLLLDRGLSRIDEIADGPRLRSHVEQETKPLRPEFGGNESDARDITAWTIETGDETESDRIDADRDDDGYDRGGGLRGDRRT